MSKTVWVVMWHEFGGASTRLMGVFEHEEDARGVVVPPWLDPAHISFSEHIVVGSGE